MKTINFIKTLVPLALCTCMTLSFVGCDNTKAPTPTPDQNPSIETPADPTPDKPTPDKPSAPTLDTKAYDEFVAKMAACKNYAYTQTVNGTKTTYDINDQVVLVNEYETYFYKDNGKVYRLDWSDNDKKYHKTYGEDYDVNAYILTPMQNAEITSYDDAKKEYKITFSGNQCVMTVGADEIVIKNNNDTYRVNEVDNNRINLPGSMYIVDDTGKQEEPTTEEKVYTTNAQGERVYNSKLLGEIVKETLNTVQSNGKTLYNAKTYQTGDEIDRVLAVSSNESQKIEIFTISSVSGGKIVDAISIDKSKVASFADNKQVWTTGLTASGVLKCGSFITISQDISVANKTTLTQVTEKVLQKLASDGVQSELSATGTPLPRYANAEVVEVFQMPDGLDGTAGLGLGNTHRFGLFAVVLDKDKQPVVLQVNVATTSYKTAYETILNPGINDKFIVYKKTKEQNADKQFFENTATKTAAARETAMLPQGKEKEA